VTGGQARAVASSIACQNKLLAAGLVSSVLLVGAQQVCCGTCGNDERDDWFHTHSKQLNSTSQPSLALLRLA
jgi:hypothetical protein